MTFRDAIQEGIRLLSELDTPFLDASVLLGHAADMPRERLLASYPDLLTDDQENRYRKLLSQRLEGLPVAYLVGEKEFFGRPFVVDARVLTPRPDTEILVERGLLAAETLRSEGKANPLKVADVCTGSGCVALTVTLEDENIEMTASDLSPDAAEVFTRNRQILAPDGSDGARRIRFRHGDLLADDPGPYHIILSNPPYLTTAEVEEKREEKWPEPEMALEGGADGLDLIRKLVVQSQDILYENGYLIIEAASDQMIAIGEILQQAGFSQIKVSPDLAGRDRVIEGRIIGTQDRPV